MSNELKYLWAPWRMGYIRTSKNEFGPCLFCDKSNIGKDEENLVVHRGELSYVLMNLYPYNNGHLMIAPYDHERNFDDLQSDTQVEMMNLMSLSMEVLRGSLSADGFNFGLNVGKCSGAGIDNHIHFHIVPRWNGDNNFMPVIGNTKVIVQGLFDTYDVLYPSFKKIS